MGFGIEIHLKNKQTKLTIEGWFEQIILTTLM